MKKVFQFGFALAIGSGLLVSCDTAPKGDSAAVTDAAAAAAAVGMTLNVDTASSSVTFTGNGVGKNHPGHFKVSNGSLALKGTEITGGTFTIDINSMAMHESGDHITGKLRPHMLSADFFDATVFPTATFEITGVQPYTPAAGDSSVVAGANMRISGNLKLKDSVKNVSFPAKVSVADGSVSAVANFDIDRTLWGMSYGNDASLGDKFISPTVNLALNISAKK
ncbi:MAG: YceI family protein [Flavobacteriales bacterium]|nr:YceI family protein [Flavobacteriales bacterium]